MQRGKKFKLHYFKLVTADQMLCFSHVKCYQYHILMNGEYENRNSPTLGGSIPLSVSSNFQQCSAAFQLNIFESGIILHFYHI